MNENLLNRILRDHKRRTRSLALILCLSMLVSLGTFAGFHKTAVAKVYTNEILDCPYTHEGAEKVAHTHNDDCYDGETLVCSLPEIEAHTHSEECFEEREVPVCGLEENPGHQHTESCYTEREELRCGLEENPGHQHDQNCYNADGALICTIPEGEGAHTHTPECYETVRELTCTVPEGEGAHIHTAECYETVRELICDKPELPVHVHGPECFRTEEVTTGEEEKTLPEMPVGDPNADLETASDWERDFDGMELSGNWATDLVLVAATQQGHGESPNNFEAVLNDAGDAWVRHGYTRYGAWYGAPYAEEWSAMFVSFCLRYAGIPAENVPNNPTAAYMAESFSKGELFAGRGYVPAVGDLIFFDTGKAEGIDHMGIVYYVDEENGTINTVEGDRSDIVATFGYHMDDDEIVGYGILPQNPDYIPAEEGKEDNETDNLTEEKKENEETKDTVKETVPAAPMPAQSWERTAGGIKVVVEAPEGAFPENTQIAVTPVNGNNLKDTVSDAVNGEILEVQAVDITFFTAEGREIEPAVPIRVVMTPYENHHTEDKANVVHIDLEQQTAEVIAQAEGTEFDNSEVVFDAEAFTIYAIVYTYQVEYEYEVDGKTFTSSMPGAENMTLTQIVEGLGIVDETEIDTFVSKIVSIASSNEEVAVVNENNEIRVLKDGEAKIVITMQDGAVFQIRVIANGETKVTADNVAISTVGDLYLPENAVANAAIVDGAEAIEAVKAETGEETEYTVFDISLENVDAEQYEEGFEVTVALDSNITGKDFRLYHVHDGQMEDITASLALEGPVDENGVQNVTAFSFQTESFSDFVLSYTVDFFYGEYEYHLIGRGTMLLSDLFRALGIDRTVDDVSEVVFSNPEVLSVSKNEENSDWILVSLMPFTSEETLTVTMKNGDVVTINVTDAVSESEALDALNNYGYIDLANEENTQFLHVSAESSVTETEQERDAAFKLTFTYSLEEDVVKAIDQYDQLFSLKYDLTSTINSSPLEIRNNSNGVISIGSRKLGTYTIVDGVVTLHFTDPSFFDGRTSFTGYFNLTAETNETELGSYDEWTYSFPGTGDTIPIHYKKTVEEGSKNVNSIKNADGSYTLHYTANINVNSDLDSLTFYDTLSGLQTLDASSVKINGTSVSVSQTGNGFNFDVASALGTTGVAKGSYQVTYDTKVTAAQLEAMTADQTIEKNTASWKVNGDKDVPGGETTVEINKPVPPIPVEKTSSSSGTNQPGDTITYNVSYGDANTALAGFHISDSITDVVIPQGTNVTLNYGNGQTVTVPFNSQATDSSYGKGTVTLFDYTFPAGTEGNGPVTVTYSVKLIDADTAKENGVYDTTSVANTAIEHRQNTSDTETTTVTYEKEPSYTVEKTASANPTDEDGHWLPGSTITYTLTIGDADTNMAGVNIKDVMTDLQVLQGDIMIQVGNGSQMRLSDYDSDAIKWTDDGQYSTNDVELFNFNMPSNAGNGPVVITYTTKVISQEQATANGIYGDVTIKNTGYGGKQSDGTNGTGSFNPYPIEKTVTKSNADVNGQTVEMGDTVHYTLTFGDSTMNMGGVTILDEMTDLQKLVSDVTIRKPDGTTVTMPMGSGQWSDNGVVWNYFDDGKYSTQMVRVFSYKLPSDFGNGPITVEYDAQIISEDEANESGIKDTKDAYNIFTVNNHQAQTDVKIDFPTDPKHEPQISKKFDRWDIDNNKVYWTITVEKTADSAYPLENIKVSEGSYGGITITESKVAGWNNHGISEDEYKLFDVVNAVVTTDDGTVLTPGVDYTIDKDKASFTFPVLNERVHINFAFTSPIKIIDGFKMHNKAHVTWVNEWTRKVAEADAEYNKPGITIVKNGTYTEDDRFIKWEVSLNPSKNAFVDSDPLHVWFEDQLPSGITLVNYSTKSEDNPSISVYYKGNWWYDPFEVNVSVDENNAISQTDIAAHTQYNGEHGLDGNNIVVTYYTKISDDEWNRITSSASGSETFENKVTITAGNGEQFGDSDDVTVTTEGYLKKYDTTQDRGGIVIDPDSGENSKNITYSVDINPNGYVLNSHNTLTLTDYISTNMDLDTASVQIYEAEKGVDGRLVSKNTFPVGLQVSYNDDSRLLSIQNIPDETPLLLTYTCIARAQGQDTFRNTATLIGGGSHSSSTTEEHNIQTNDAGILIDGIELSLHKIDENNISKNLSGAKFQLYECQLAIGELTNPENYSQDWWEALLAKVDRMTAGTATQEEINEVKTNFKITGYIPVGGPVETGDSGYTQWSSLNEHKLYAWVETEAPENYIGYAPDDYHYFVGYQHIDVNSDVLPQPLLSAEEQLARKHAAWALDDACQFANGIRVASMSNLTTWTATNVESHYTSISASKEWEGDSDNLFETRPTEGIQLQLWVIKADGTRETVGAPVSINVSEDTGEWPTYIWNRLPSEDEDGNTLKYTVTEKRVENYSTTYSDNGAGQSSGTITVTNRMIPKSTDIYVEKRFAEGTEKPAYIKVTLCVIKTDKNDVVSEPEETSYEAILSETNNWKWHWDKLPTTQVIDGKAYYLSYTVIEDTAALEREGFRYTVSYSDKGEGVIETTENEPLVITNAKETGKIIVKKTFSGVTDETDLAALQNGLTVTVSGKDVGGKGVDTLTLTWNDVKDDGYEITHLPTDETYTVTEEISADSVLPKYTVTSETVSSATITATVDGGTAELKNVYEEAPQTGSLKISKNVTVSAGADISKADGTYTFEIWKQIQSGEETSAIQVTKKADGTTDIGELKITVTNGAASPAEIIVDGLEAGTYIVKETVSSNTAMMPDTSVTGYDSDLGGIVVTVSAGDTAGVKTAAFTNKYETTEATVKKVWAEGEPPESLEVELVADGVPTSQQVTLNKTNSWEDKITGLPKYKNGVEINYSWLEGEMPSGYFLTNVEKNGLITTLTNTKSEYDLKTSYVGVKTWEDNSNGWSTRPPKLVVKLYKIEQSSSGVYPGTGTEMEGVTPEWTYDETSNQWTYTFKNLPVFDDNGNVIKYYAEEEVPHGYTGEKSKEDTTWTYGTIYGENKTTQCNEMDWELESLIDLSFVAVKMTGNHDDQYKNAVAVWTHRVPTPNEKQQIETKVKQLLPGCEGRHFVYISGIGEVNTPNGGITVTYNQETMKVHIQFRDPSNWSMFAYGHFTGTAYESGKTNFTNTLEETELSGTKTWKLSDNRTINNASDVTLKLTRTTTVDDVTSTPEVIYAKSAVEKTVYSPTTTTQLLQPTWNENSFNYAHLPAKDTNGNAYTYSVVEWQFKVGETTYSVGADGKVTKDNVSAPDMKVTQAGNDIINAEIKDFEFNKEWLAPGGDPVNEWKDEITVKVFRQIEGTEDTSFVLQYTINSGNYSSSDGIEPDSSESTGTQKLQYQDGTRFQFKVGELEKYGKIEETEGEFTYFVKEIVWPATGYMPPAYKDADGNEIQTGAGNGGKAPHQGTIVNQENAGIELPQTGGIGTTLFTALGGLMTVTAGAILTMRRGKRKTAES